MMSLKNEKRFKTAGKVLIAIVIVFTMYGHARMAWATSGWDETDSCREREGSVQCCSKGCRCLLPDGPWR